MAGVRRAARYAHIGLLGLFLVGVVVQFFLAGLAAFGETDWDLHETLGFTAVHLVSLLVFVAALVGWIGRNAILANLLIPVLTTLQVALPEADGWIAALHPVNALVMFVVGHVLLRRSLHALRAAPPAEPAPGPV